MQAFRTHLCSLASPHYRCVAAVRVPDIRPARSTSVYGRRLPFIGSRAPQLFADRLANHGLDGLGLDRPLQCLVDERLIAPVAGLGLEVSR